ncbi:minor capsid protein [Latilactobacillus fragifolii]|uniref:minor capsid protein n=1 Tax=Latilactobacillus fragifolii TaxID=2814244 RepID=UPI001ABB2B7C|nr:minor capsid protein [Latilactobacillus fragifolii]
MNSREYWEKRLNKILQNADETDLEYFYELQSLFAVYSKKVQEAVFAFYQKYADENGISYSEAKKRLNKEDLATYQANANRYFSQSIKDATLLEILNTQYMSAKASRLDALDLEMAAITSALGKEFEGSLQSYLESVIKSVYGNLAESQINIRALKNIVESKWAGDNFSGRIWGNAGKLAEELREILKKGFIRNATPAEMARELRKTFNVKRAQAETLVRTETTHVITDTTIESYKKAGFTKYQYLAHLDSRTTEICRDLNGDIFAIKNYQPGLNAPPMHPNCRSTITPTDQELN